MHHIQVKSPQLALRELAQRNQWVCWRRVKRENSKVEKVPLDPRTRRWASTDAPDTWGSYEQATTTAQEHGYDGVGFVFTADDPYCGVDLDGCINPETGEVEAWAVEIVETLDSYAEVSPSGTGIKVFVRASKPGKRCRTGNVEMYDTGQFFTFTGRRYSGDGIEPRQDELEGLYHRLFPEQDGTARVQSGTGFAGDDGELLNKARSNSRTGELFARLYAHGNWSGFRSQSEADLRLCTILAFWCGPDEERIDRLFRGSKLYREKWDTGRGHSTYGEQTVLAAIKGCDYFYDPAYGARAKNAVQDALIRRMEWAIAYAWPGRGGPTDRDVYRALLRQAWKYGGLHPEGIDVCMSARDIGPEACIGSRGTVTNALRRLADKHGVVGVLDKGDPRKAARYLLREDVLKVGPYIRRVIGMAYLRVRS